MEGGGNQPSLFGDSFEDPPPRRLVIDIAGFEGPLDLLLSLARDQKVDLSRLSILELAEQYLAFIARLDRSQLEEAADYLVMAAWLAYLKSRLLLPQSPPDDEPSGAEMAEALAFQLRRLEAMRAVGGQLAARPRLYRDVWSRGSPEEFGAAEKPVWDVSLFTLLKSYGAIAARRAVTALDIEVSDLYSVDAAIARLRTMLGDIPDWADLQSFLPAELHGLHLRSAMSAHFVAALELCRQGRLEIHQEAAFAPLWMRSREGRDE